MRASLTVLPLVGCLAVLAPALPGRALAWHAAVTPVQVFRAVLLNFSQKEMLGVQTVLADSTAADERSQSTFEVSSLSLQTPEAQPSDTPDSSTTVGTPTASIIALVSGLGFKSL